MLAALIAIGGGATVAAAAAARRTDTAFDRMLDETREADLAVYPGGPFGSGDLDPALLDEVMLLDGVRGVSEVALVAVSVAEYQTFYSVAFVEERGEAPRPSLSRGQQGTTSPTWPPTKC